jgi:hypothetical protein
MSSDTPRLRVKNWRRFQHFPKKDTPPPWIKLHRVLLDDAEFNKLHTSKRYQLIAIWLLAASSSGEIPHDNAFVARRIGARNVDLDAFVSQGWLESVEPDGSTERF